MLKKITSLILLAVMVMAMGTSTFASEIEVQAKTKTMQISVSPETDIEIVIPNELASQISEEEIQGLIENQMLKDGDTITIIAVDNLVDPLVNVQPRWGYTYETTKSLSSEWKAQDYFVISAAKGQTTTLSSKFSATVTTNITAGNPFVEADIGGSVTAEYSITHEFVGPPEGSRYNSREFRVQFYGKTATWTQKKINSSGDVVETRTGKAKIPTKYLLYSIDRSL